MAPRDEQELGRHKAMIGSRAWARRAMLAAIAGGGLTGVGLAGSLPTALAAEATSGTTSVVETSSSPTTTGEATTTAPESEPPSTTTTSTPAPVTTTTTTAPAPATGDAGAPASTPAPTATAPAVTVQRQQPTTTSGRRDTGDSSKTGSTTKGAQGTTGGSQKASTGPTTAGGANNLAAPPQTVAAQVNGLSSLLSGASISAASLDYYRIPLFLLPIYQAAGIQYGVPWQILAAINEVETDYGSDLSVSTAGAVGWMQFMPATWLQYGVDATSAGYADPYNPVDAIFAAARYLHAAGASHDLHAAILAYNHSDAYLSSVLLRARLIASYPQSVVATLTGLIEGRDPMVGAKVAGGATSTLWTPAGTTGVAAPSPTALSASSATANAVPTAADARKNSGSASGSGSGVTTPGSSPPPSPKATAARAEAEADAPASSAQLTDLIAAPDSQVVAVQDGRVVKLGDSRKIGKYIVLRDVYGDLYTYAGLGKIVPDYAVLDPKTKKTTGKGAVASKSSVSASEPARDPAPKLPASAGHQPRTLKVEHPSTPASSEPASEAEASAEAATVPPGMGRARVFAHPDNPDAKAADLTRSRPSAKSGTRMLRLRVGSVVSQGTVLGYSATPAGAQAGHLRFAIRPAGDRTTIDPRPVLANWKQLDTALHPQGSKLAAGDGLLGATVADVFLMSKGELERAVLSDPGVEIYACGRQDIASGAIDKRVLAVLEFLSRSGLKPTVSALRCGHSEYTTSGNVSEHYTGDAVDISAINGIPIAGHQGAGSITDVTIRALLTLQGQFVPHQIISLMQYPEAPNTLALPEHWNHIHVGFRPVGATVPAASSSAASAAHSAGAGATAPSPLTVTGDLSSTQWNQLIARIAALPEPKVAHKPSSSAIRDPQAAPGNRDLGTRWLPSSGSTGE